MIIAKQFTTEPIINQDRYELYVNKIVKDINDKDFTISESIGIYSITDLNSQKTYFLNEIVKIDEKLNAINAI